MANRLRVIHKPAGYQAYKDVVPIRGVNIRAITSIAGAIFAAGVVVTLTVLSVISGNSAPAPTLVADLVPPQISPTHTDQPTDLPVFTEIPTHTPTHTPTPIPVLQMTMDAMQSRLDALRSTPQQIQQVVVVTATPQQIQQVVQTATPMITSTPAWDRWAVVVVDCAVVRAAPGRNYQALGSACRGARFPVIDSFNEWTQIYYEGFNSAWIASHLLRIEYD